MKQLDIPKLNKTIEFLYDEGFLAQNNINDQCSTICYVQCVKTSTTTFITTALPTNLLAIKIEDYIKKYNTHY